MENLNSLNFREDNCLDIEYDEATLCLDIFEQNSDGEYLYAIPEINHQDNTGTFL